MDLHRGAGFHVRVHYPLRYEPLPADHAHVWPLPRVRPLMYPQRRPLRETLAAILADKRLFARVHPLVLLQLLLPGEALGAHLAGEGFVSSVDPPMELQLLFAGQPLPADVAEHGRVYARGIVLAEVVPLETCGGGVVLVADGAVVLHQGAARHDLPVLRPTVRRQEPGEHEVFAADLALEGLFSGVEILVFYGVGTHGESLAAYLALVLSSALVGSHVHLDVVFGSISVIAQVTFVFVVLRVLNRMQGESHIVLVRLVASFAVYGLV